jgi:uncharacterized membrane protein
VISKSLKKHHIGIEPGFQWRGDEITRIEGLSDAVFAFAVTILIISLEVPKTIDDFYRVLQGLPAFAATFFLLMLVWYQQYRFFRRYGLQDLKTLVLSLMLLFVVLYFVYPLKFLFTQLLDPVGQLIFPTAAHETVRIFNSADDTVRLMVLYHSGIIAVYGLLLLLYRHAYQQREILSLNTVELHDTNDSIVAAWFFVLLSTTGLLMSFIGPTFAGISGQMYGPACAIFFTLQGRWSDKKRKKLLVALEGV